MEPFEITENEGAVSHSGEDGGSKSPVEDEYSVNSSRYWGDAYLQRPSSSHHSSFVSEHDDAEDDIEMGNEEGEEENGDDKDEREDVDENEIPRRKRDRKGRFTQPTESSGT